MIFREFYPIYLAGHRKRLNRAIHYTGALAAIASAAVAIARQDLGLFPAAVALIYLVLWLSHLYIEHNRPLTWAGGWKMVAFSMYGEFYMTWRFLTGRISADLERYGIREE